MTGAYEGPDSFNYRASDGITSSTATVIIQAGHLPVATNDSISTNEDTALTFTAASLLTNDTDADGDPLTVSIVAQPTHGTLEPSGSSFIYRPTANYNGPDSFTYQASDGFAPSNTATVSITVNSVNDPPTAADNTYTAYKNELLTIAAPGVRGNDTDIENSTLTVSAVTGQQPGNIGQTLSTTHGSLTLYADGHFTYMPGNNFTGTDSFTYQVSDGSAASNTATVTINVLTRPDIVLDDFSSDGTHLLIGYSVQDAVPAAYKITLFASPDGSTLNQQLWQTSGSTALGSHSLSFIPTYDDPAGDYYLVAVVDSNIEVQESDETNNWQLFSGGIFTVQQASNNKTVLHVQGGSAADNATAELIEGGENEEPVLRITQNEVTYDLSLDAIDEIHFRGHDGDDSFLTDSSLLLSTLLLGGTGDDTLTGGGASDVIDGGNGDNVLTGAAGNDLLVADSGNNTLVGDAGNDAIIVGNGNNSIQAGEGDDYVSVGNGNNDIDGDNGNDVVETGTGDNEVDGGNGNDEVNGLIGLPVIGIQTSPSVQEGNELTVIVWLSQPTDHDVTATLEVRTTSGDLASDRWESALLSILIPAGETSALVTLSAIDDSVPNDAAYFNVALAGVFGATPGNDSSASVSVYDVNVGIFVTWSGGSAVPTAFSGTIPAIINADGSIDSDCTGTSACIDNYGHSFQIHIATDQTTGVQTFDMTIQGIPNNWPPGVAHWTGSSDGDTPFAIVADAAFGTGRWDIVGPPDILPSCGSPASQTPHQVTAASSFRGITKDQDVFQRGQLDFQSNTILVNQEWQENKQRVYTTTGQLVLSGNYYTETDGSNVFDTFAAAELRNFVNAGNVAFGPTSEIYKVRWMKTGNILTEDTVLHASQEGGKYCTQVVTVIAGLRRLDDEEKVTFGLGIGPLTINDSGFSLSNPIGGPFTVKVGISQVRNQDALEGGTFVGGKPEIVMAAAIAADGQTLTHHETLTDKTRIYLEDWWEIVLHSNIYQRKLIERQMIDTVQ